MFLLKKAHQPGVYVPLRAFFLVMKYIGLFLGMSYLFRVCIFQASSVPLKRHYRNVRKQV